jgi:putative ABC transport system substrate-binding protein
MERREFIILLGGAAAAWPLMARAQNAVPIIGFLGTGSEAHSEGQVNAFRRGLSQLGFHEGRNVAFEFRWAEGRYERLPAMAAELARRPVALILANAPPAALTAKATTATIPIVFVVGFDPVAAGLVASLGRPGGNATGMTLISVVLGQKRLEILREIAPKAAVVAMLANPTSPDAVPEIGSVQAAAQLMGVELAMFNVSAVSEFPTTFAAIAQRRPDAVLVGTDPLFVNQRDEIVALANPLRLPTIYPFREYATSGGLVSYGSSIPNAYRQAGIYAARILKGEKPAELAVQQPTTFELVINLKTGRALGLEVPPTLLARADEVIE